jgi:hypothetical protein
MSEVKEAEKLLRDIFGEPQGFLDELTALINKYSLENRSNTPDFILARIMCNALQSFEDRVIERENWYKRETQPSQDKH